MLSRRHRRFLLALACFVVGCVPSALPGGGGDGGALADLVRGPDWPALLSCMDAQRAVSQWIASHRACVVDDDCTWHVTGCGLEHECGGYISKRASADTRASLVDYYKRTCGPMCKPCPPFEPPLPGCVAGVCAHKER